MAHNDKSVDTAELGLLSLQDIYKTVQDQLTSTIQRSLDMGRTSLAERLDDVLLRQRFWEVDIHFEDGALSDLAASDKLASSIVRDCLNEIRLSLHHINENIDDPE